MRCHLGCVRWILTVSPDGVWSISAARQRMRSSDPGSSPLSSGSDWPTTGRSSSRCVRTRREWRRASRSTAECSRPAIRAPSHSPARSHVRSGVEAEAYVPGGAALPSTDHARAFAEAFARLIRLAPRPTEVPTLEPAPSWAAWDHAGDGLWPRPEEDPDVNLNEVAGPEWIDDAGRRARDRLRAGEPEAVIGHCDWLAGNLRWNGDELLVVHDWDSTIADSEPVLVGFAAALYPAVDADGPATVEDSERFLVAYCDTAWSGVQRRRARAVVGGWRVDQDVRRQVSARGR